LIANPAHGVLSEPMPGRDAEAPPTFGLRRELRRWPSRSPDPAASPTSPSAVIRKRPSKSGWCAVCTRWWRTAQLWRLAAASSAPEPAPTLRGVATSKQDRPSRLARARPDHCATPPAASSRCRSSSGG
jgi:hypothetical protein